MITDKGTDLFWPPILGHPGSVVTFIAMNGLLVDISNCQKMFFFFEELEEINF